MFGGFWELKSHMDVELEENAWSWQWRWCLDSLSFAGTCASALFHSTDGPANDFLANFKDKLMHMETSRIGKAKQKWQSDKRPLSFYQFLCRLIRDRPANWLKTHTVSLLTFSHSWHSQT